MKALNVFVAAFALCLGLASPKGASAQEINFGALEEDQHNIVHLKAGAESGFVASVGYSRIVSVWDRPLVLTAELTVPWAEFDMNDYELRMGGMISIVGDNEWKLAGRLVPTVRGIQNDMARLTALATDFGLVGGYYGQNWFVAAEAGFDWTITTKVSHSQAYRDDVYDDAKNGWYRTPGGNFYAGLFGGYSFKRYDLVLRAGVDRDIQGGDHILPVHATVGFNTRW